MNMDNDNIEALYHQKCEEYDNLAIEYEEMRDLSSQIEKELEAEADHLTKEKKKLVEENEKMQHQILEIKKKYASEISYLEKVTERLETDNKKMKEEREIKSRTLMQNEIEVERLESQIRESDAVISDLENKIDHVLEKLAMVQSQLEFQKMENEEEVQRLKDQLQESEGEVLACRIRASANNSNLGQLDGQQQSHNPYFDLVLRDRNGSGEFEEKRSKKRVPTVELGKRSYFDRDEDSYQTKSKSRASKNQLGVSANALDYNMTGFPLEGYSGGQWNELFKENYAHNNLQNFDSFNLINQSFSNSITTVKDMIEDLGKPSQNGMFLSNNHNNLSSTNMFTSSNGAGNL